MADKTPNLLTAEQRLWFTAIPADLPQTSIVQYYTLSAEDIGFIRRQHGQANRLGMAVQLCILRFPGRPLTDLPGIPENVLHYVAQQVQIPATHFARYGERTDTLYEHLARIRRVYGYREYSGEEIVPLIRSLLPLAMESDEVLPLVEAALLYLREGKVIAPAITTIEGVVWRVLRIARWRVYHRLTRSLTSTHRETLDKLLQVDKAKSNLSLLAWLRQPAAHPSADSLYHLLERLVFVKQLHLPALSDNVHSNRVRQLAQQCRHYKAQPLSPFKAPRRHAYLVAYLGGFVGETTDEVVLMFDRWFGDLIRRGKNAQKHRLYRSVAELNKALNTLTAAMEAFLAARESGADPVAALLAVVDEAELKATVVLAKTHMRPANLDFRDLLEDRYTHRRKAMLQMYRDLSFESVAEEDPALCALDYVVLFQDQLKKRVTAVSQQIKQEEYTAPLDHLKYTYWKRHALLEKGNINPNFYEMAAWQRLREGVRSGDIAVQESRRYRKFESYLLTAQTWQKLKDTQQTRLAITDMEAYLQTRHTQIKELVEKLPALLEKENPLSVGKDGLLHLAGDEKSTPDEVEEWERRLYRPMPEMQLADVIVEVAGWTGCLQPFTHLGTGQLAEGKDKERLIATILGPGLNLGLAKMAQATPFSWEELSQMAEWYVRPEAIRQAQIILDNFVLHHPFAKYWGEGKSSSSDGMRVVVPVEAVNTVYNARYFFFERGLTIVTHAADIWMPYRTDIAGDEREALHVIDALCHHETDFDILEHYTDTGGYTYHVFALCCLLGFRFAPRIRSITEQFLFTVEPLAVAKEVEYLVKGTVNKDLIRDYGDEMGRFAASIRQGTASASLLMRKLAAYPRQSRLAQAFNEMGKLERTLFVLQYLQDKPFRQRIRRGLNKGEAIHHLARALAIGQLGELREREADDQLNRASCLMLLVSMISAWNTVYLAKSVAALEEKGTPVPEEYLAHISPLHWSHINFLGQYEVDLSQAYPLDKLRSLHFPD
ncbi:MAG: Tn3 family transposase [Chloroflexi bacterium]|nr:Tn3 family transposase [Chloroflexota bacterium]MCI0645170.1 Tn3 family transposase [Chloroflexota bacterium]MCI0726180.1 Tn3 family transposase [Chloroflexota bacterium]